MNSPAGETEIVWRLFKQHVPAVASGSVEIRGIVREPGNRSIVVVVQKDPAVDPVGACLGSEYNSRVKRIVAELPEECLDIVRWDDSVEQFIAHLVAPSKFVRASFDEATRHVRIVLAPDSMRPTELTLRSKILSQLTGWHLTVELPNER
jgi:transcription termination/antitermination protein NusA